MRSASNGCEWGTYLSLGLRRLDARSALCGGHRAVRLHPHWIPPPPSLKLPPPRALPPRRIPPSMSTFDIARVDNPSRHFGSATGDSIYSRTETVVSRSTPKATPSRVPPQSLPSDAQSDLAESCAELVTERTFEALMDDTIARFKFRDYLMVCRRRLEGLGTDSEPR